ncbi:hypothetical protein M569_11331, partial [Genlisea aurea]
KSRPRSTMVRASSTSGRDPISPLELESPVGQLLSQALQTHPHLLMAAVEQQLENLQRQRDEGKKEPSRPQSKNTASTPSSDDVLYKRIAEFKEKERRKAVEEIMYCLIVHRFVDNNISMIPKISTSMDERVDLWPNQEQKLESVHSPEAFEMVLSHLSLVLGERMTTTTGGPSEDPSVVQISKIKLGKLYASSIMYGYFLRRVDERYQLERSVNTLPPPVGRQLWDPASLIRIYPDGAAYPEDDGSHKLRSYVMYLDAETLQKYATMRSKEALSLIEKQTQAVFGKPEISVTEEGSLDAADDETFSVSFPDLTVLVLEAVAFGSFLWDAETFVESKYSFVNA